MLPLRKNYKKTWAGSGTTLPTATPTFVSVTPDCGKQRSQRCSDGIPLAQLIPLRSRLLACKLDNSVDVISIKVTLKTISWYDTPHADRRGDQRKRPLTCRRYQAWCGIHYCHLPFKVCHLPFYAARGIDHFAAHLEEILPKVTPERTVETLERKGRRDFIFSFANELLDELIKSLD